MRRRADWPERLGAFLESRREQAFCWGKNDCALFACDAIRTMMDVDPAEGFRLQYSTARGAARKMKAFCGGGLEEVAEKIAREHGFEEVGVGLAGRGDAVLFDKVVSFQEGREVHRVASTGKTLGIVGLEGTHALLAGPAGMERVPVGACRRAWRVG